MGCDIHIMVERQATINKTKKWINCDHWKINAYSDREDEKYQRVEIYNDRNYTLFSILAGVRSNGENAQICPPKGVPLDCCDEIKGEIIRWNGDGHSHSWFTLGELNRARNTFRKTRYSGMVDEEGREQIKRGEMPNSWCQWTNTPGYSYVEWEHECDELAAIIEPLTQRFIEEFWIFGDDYDKALEDQIRIVFWFDN